MYGNSMVFGCPCFGFRGSEGTDQNHPRRRIRWRRRSGTAHAATNLAVPSTNPPRYHLVARSQCPLLEACWNQDWEHARQRLRQHPEEAFYQNVTTRRTALHLAMIPSSTVCPFLVRELLRVNPHAVIVSDRHRFGGTPLHFACGNVSVRSNPSLMRCLIQAVIQQSHHPPYRQPRIHSWSPLFLAARRGAPAVVIEQLVQASSRCLWVAPWTGGETYHQQIFCCLANDSPLEGLWNHVRHHFIIDYNANEGNTCIATMKQSSSSFELASERVHDQSICGWGIVPTEDEMNMLQQLSDIPVGILVQAMDQHPKDAEFIIAWIQLLVLLRAPSHQIYKVVSCLYHPIPSLLAFVVRLVPQQALQRNETAATKITRIPLHDALRHNTGGRQLACIRIIVNSDPQVLTIMDDETGLYPVLLAATLDYDETLLFEMIRLFPPAVSRETGK